VEEPKHLKVYLPKQLFIVKELLKDTEAKEKTFVPSKANMQKEKCELEVHVHSLTSNFLDQKNSLTRS
jgi:hypothetical protein